MNMNRSGVIENRANVNITFSNPVYCTKMSLKDGQIWHF